jgi:hypothetical protein
VFLQDGENDINITEGNWTLGNINMESAMKFARYDYRFEMGTGGHDLNHGGAIFPETLRWIWRDYPGVKGADDAPVYDAVVGEWDVVTNVLGEVSRSVLTVSAQDGALTAKLEDDEDGEIEVKTISFEDDILSYEYMPPQSQMSWGKGSNGTMKAWLKVTGNTFEGALSSGAKSQTQIDFSVKGRKKGTTPDAD